MPSVPGHNLASVLGCVDGGTELFTIASHTFCCSQTLSHQNATPPSYNKFSVSFLHLICFLLQTFPWQADLKPKVRGRKALESPLVHTKKSRWLTVIKMPYNYPALQLNNLVGIQFCKNNRHCYCPGLPVAVTATNQISDKVSHHHSAAQSTYIQMLVFGEKHSSWNAMK